MCVRNPNVFTGIRRKLLANSWICVYGWGVIPVRALASLTLSSVDSFVFTAFLPEEVQRPVFILVNADFLETHSGNGLRGPAAQLLTYCPQYSVDES